MQAYNQTRQCVLAEEVLLAFDFWSRLKGLLGAGSLPEGRGLLLKPCQGVHSFFMRFAFDAIFLDAELRVVHIIESLPPFRISPVIREACSVLELPTGTVRRSGSKVGDQLSLKALIE